MSRRLNELPLCHHDVRIFQYDWLLWCDQHVPLLVEAMVLRRALRLCVFLPSEARIVTRALLIALDALQPLVHKCIADYVGGLLLLLLLLRSHVVRLVCPPLLLLSPGLCLGVDFGQLGREWVHRHDRASISALLCGTGILPVLAAASGALQASRSTRRVLRVFLSGEPLQSLIQILQLFLLLTLDLTHVRAFTVNLALLLLGRLLRPVFSTSKVHI